MKSIYLQRDRKNLPNPNGLIFGMAGSGKSYFLKREMEYVMEAYPEDKVILFDPNNSFPDFVAERNGRQIIISGDENFNPLEVENLEDTNCNYLWEKEQFILGLFNHITGNHELSPFDINVICRCLHKTYEPYRQVIQERKAAGYKDAAKCPNLHDLCDTLILDGTPEGGRIAMTLEPYITGNNSILCGKSNIKYDDDKFVAFNFGRNLPYSLASTIFISAVENVCNHMIARKKDGRFVWLFIDDMHWLTIPGFAEMFSFFYKMTERNDIIMTGVTQSIRDLSDTDGGKGILNATRNLMLLNETASDLEELKKFYALPDNLTGVITNQIPGVGLVYGGREFVPVNYNI